MDSLDAMDCPNRASHQLFRDGGNNDIEFYDVIKHEEEHNIANFVDPKANAKKNIKKNIFSMIDNTLGGAQSNLA